MKKWLALGIVFPLGALFAAEPQPSSCVKAVPNGACLMYDVSIVQLISNPSTYHGKPIRVIGYLNLEFEGNAVYLHREDHEHSLYKNGLWVEIPKAVRDSRLCTSKRYAIIEGTFNANDLGHMGLWSGSIQAVSRCDAM